MCGRRSDAALVADIADAVARLIELHERAAPAAIDDDRDVQEMVRAR